MRTIKVMVRFRGATHFIDVPCNGNESLEVLQQYAIKMLKRREDKKREKNNARVMWMIENNLTCKRSPYEYFI